MKRLRTQSSAKDKFTHLLNLDLSGAALTVCLASSPVESLPEYRRLSITDGVRQEFENVIRNVRSGFNSEDVVFRQYDAGSKPDAHEIEYFALTEADFVADQFAALNAPTSLSIFSGADEAFLAELRFYVIVQQSAKEEPVYWFRIYSQQKDMFLFDQYLDCVTMAGFMFVFRQDGFQKIFRYYERVKEAAAESLARIEATIPIANFDDFQKDCEAIFRSSPSCENIAQKPYLDQIG